MSPADRTDDEATEPTQSHEAPRSDEWPESPLSAAIALAEDASSLEVRIDRRLSRIGISFTDLRRLLAIAAGPTGLTREQIAEAMNESASQSLRETRPLEKLGWLSRTDTGAFVLTDSGRHLTAQGEGLAEAAAAEWFAAHPPGPSPGASPAPWTRTAARP